MHLRISRRRVTFANKKWLSQCSTCRSQIQEKNCWKTNKVTAELTEKADDVADKGDDDGDSYKKTKTVAA